MQTHRHSAQFNLRLPEGLREALKKRANGNGRSMNAEIVFMLEKALNGGEKPMERPKPINRISLEDVELMRDHAQDRRNALDAYQQAATHSAIYPGRGTTLGLVYVALKMNGEAGEFAEHVGKAMRDDDLMRAQLVNSDGSGGTAMQALTPERRALLIKEIGDVLWYLSAACNELGISLSHAAEANIEKLYDRGQRNALRGSGDER